MTTLKGLNISIAYVLGSSTPPFVTFIGGVTSISEDEQFAYFE
jgi:hypothetical protein